MTEHKTRQISAAHRVLVDLGQVLASFREHIVLVGGWVPDLLFPNSEPPHVGSVDVDLALNTRQLSQGQYADLIGMLLQTGRYQKGEKDFQLLVTVDLQDGEQPVLVEVDFLAPDEPKLKKNKPKLLPNFRILQFSACTAAFMSPQRVKISGRTLTGALNEVELMVASTAGLLIMKAYAVKNRSKAKDVYDICHCLEHDPGGIAALAKDWFRHNEDPLVLEAVCCFREKFQSIDFYGPRQLAEFHGYDNEEERDFHARRAYELVQEFLRQWDSLSSFEE